MLKNKENHEGLYLEDGVTWKFSSVSEPDFNFYRVSWLHIPTGTRGETDILVRRDGPDVVYRLLNYWNRQENWKYWID